MVVDVLDVFKVQGREEGRQEGRAKTLLELLKARFGPVPAEVKARILAAKEPALARWSLRVLTARTLAGVMEPAARTSTPKSPRARKRAAKIPTR